MQLQIHHLTPGDPAFPDCLKRLHDPPTELFVAGANINDLITGPSLAAVGSRAATRYGQQVTEQLVQAASRAGVTIISGLALGVDSLAHRACLDVGGKTIAVLPTGLGRIYPSSNRQLAERIVTGVGTLVSEYSEPVAPMKHQFIARNRLIAGLASAVLITEAAERSGSLHTAQFALEAGKDVLAVPGNIFSPTSGGTNNLIKMGAIPITSTQDLLDYFGVKSQQSLVVGDTAEEQTIIELLQAGVTASQDLLIKSAQPAVTFNQTLTMLEIKAIVKPLGAGHWGLK